MIGDGSSSAGARAEREVPLVALAGTLCDERVFIPMQRRLADRELLTVAFNQHDHIEEAIQGVLTKAPPKFALLGFSLGGIVALGIAQAAPTRVLGLALIGATPHPVPDRLYHSRRASVDAARRTGLTRHVRSALWPTYVSADHSDDHELRKLVAAMAHREGIEVFKRQTELALSRPDYVPVLPEMEMPALVLAGIEDAINPPSVQKSMAANMPDARISLVPQAGHFVLLEQPDRVAAEVDNWLARVNAKAARRKTSKIRE